MTQVSIFGTGNMGTAIAGVLGEGGATVTHIGRTRPPATVTGDIVVLAVPYPAVDAILRRTGTSSPARSWSTSPTRWTSTPSTRSPCRPAAPPPPRSQSQLPSATVLKAFNTTFAATLAGKTGRRPVRPPC